MKAIVYRNYGSPDVLTIEEVEKPSPADDEALIRIRAASANPYDYHLMSGVYIMRPMSGFRRPKHTRPGVDFAGEVEAVGKSVTRFQSGDQVFGTVRGAFAEYACAPENRLASKPANLTFEQAAAVPMAGLTALQGLRDKGHIQPGQKVLINGAAGGIGTFAVQIAKYFGADVTGVCSTGSMDVVRSIGADHVIDYTAEDFTRSAERYDLMFDLAGNRSLSACLRVITPKGTFIAGGVRPGGRWIGPLPRLLKVIVGSWFVSQKVVFFIAKSSVEDLTFLRELIEANRLTPVIDRCYSLSEVPEAIRHIKEGHPRGKTVVTVAG
jgi:NADPH:quinone reductase-like Zn-dependent oxidoreductase